MQKQSEPTSRNLLSHRPITHDEREVSEILINLSYLIKRYRVDLPVWGARGRRSAIDLPPSPPRHHPEKKPKVAGDISPATPLAFSPSESEEKTRQLSVKKVMKKKFQTKEQSLQTINQLTQARESLTKELEKVKGHHNKLRAYNMVLKAKQQELTQTEPNGESKKCINTTIELTQNTTPFPFLLENHQTHHPQFLNLLQQQHRNVIFHYPCNQTHPYSSSLGLPDLNFTCDEVRDEVFGVEYSQPSNQNVQAIGGSNKERAAEARKRRMITVKGRKLKC